MSRVAKRRALLGIGFSLLMLCLEPDTAPAVSESRPSYVLKMCILPFYTSTSRASLDGDLGPLLEAALSENRWLELIPAKTVYEWSYSLQPQPWLVKGIWEGGGESRDAEVYFWLRKRLLQKARSRFPADYHVIGRVISTGMRKTLVIEVTEPGPRKAAVFTSTQGADTAEDLPDALNRAAAEIAGHLEPCWSVGYLEEVRRQYLGQVRSLASAVLEGAEQSKAHPDKLAVQVFLLSFYEEDQQAYAASAREAAAEIVRRWDGHDEAAQRLAERLGVDPFLVLCREQSREGDWSGVLTTATLGQEKNPLHSVEYERWRLRAKEELESR